jgi:hypothetical protein
LKFVLSPATTQKDDPITGDGQSMQKAQERTHRTLFGKSERMTPSGRLTHNLDDNVKIDLEQREYGCFRAPVNKVMTFRVLQEVGNLLVS